MVQIQLPRFNFNLPEPIYPCHFIFFKIFYIEKEVFDLDSGGRDAGRRMGWIGIEELSLEGDEGGGFG